MASTVLPSGIIIPEKYSRDWYADLYHNWQELDNLLGGGTPKDGTLTIQKNGSTVGTFSANQATDETINITVPDVNNGTLTIQQNGTTVDAFTANSSTDKTVNISVPTKTSDLNNDSGFITGVSWNDVADKPSFATVATSGSYNDLSNKPTIPTVNNATLTIQRNGTTIDTFTANASVDKTINISTTDDTKIPLAGSNAISGDLIPSTNGTVNLGSSSKKFASLNGIAPDELGLPTSTYTDVSSYITHFDSTPNAFNAPVSGLLFFDGTNSSPSVECAISNHTKVYKMNVAYALATLRGLFPVEKGDLISVYINQPITAVAKIFHLKGKV